MLTLVIAAVVAWIVLGTWGLGHLVRRPPGGSEGRSLALGLPTDPSEAGYAWTDDVFRTSDGVDLPLWRIEGGTADGPVIIGLHDWGASPIDMLHALDTEMPRVSTVLLLTLRGHATGTGLCSLGPREIDDVNALLATMPEPVVLAGTGFGGLIAQHCRNNDSVGELWLRGAWRDRAEGLRHILADRGQPAFPFAWTSRICLP